MAESDPHRERRHQDTRFGVGLGFALVVGASLGANVAVLVLLGAAVAGLRERELARGSRGPAEAGDGVSLVRALDEPSESGRGVSPDPDPSAAAVAAAQLPARGPGVRASAPPISTDTAQRTPLRVAPKTGPPSSPSA